MSQSRIGALLSDWRRKVSQRFNLQPEVREVAAQGGPGVVIGACLDLALDAPDELEQSLA